MKIKTCRYGEKREYNSIEEYAEQRLDGSDYDVGQLEAAVTTARNNSGAIGRLLDLLADKGLVNAEDAGNIIEGYVSGSIEFEE